MLCWNIIEQSYMRTVCWSYVFETAKTLVSPQYYYGLAYLKIMVTPSMMIGCSGENPIWTPKNSFSLFDTFPLDCFWDLAPQHKLLHLNCFNLHNFRVE